VVNPFTWRDRLRGPARFIGTLLVGATAPDLSRHWDSTSAKARFFWIIPPIAVSLFTVLLLWRTLFDVHEPTVFVEARSEHIEYVPLGRNPPGWVVKDAIIEDQSPMKIALTEVVEQIPKAHGENDDDASVVVDMGARDDKDAEDTSKVDYGFIEFSCGDQIVVSRIGNGPLRVRINAHNKAQPVRVRTRDDEYDATLNAGLGKVVTIILDNPASAFDASGEALTWPLEGQVKPGRLVGHEGSLRRGMLLSGKVELVSREFLGSGHYRVPKMDLRLGDALVLPSSERLLAEEGICLKTGVSDNSSSDKGFLNLDDMRGLNLMLSSNADGANIQRFATGDLPIRNGVFERIANDRSLALSWTLVLTFFGLYRFLVRSWLLEFVQLAVDQPARPAATSIEKENHAS